ncbi:hypothetical protein VNO80_14880 [Phaseolus coccineus]|uniref:Uncharacterized protein n=1 Tax=Phaseolus coccineus TaxID=3886 RepID=A0AAN9MIT4_PHACN
MRCLRWDIRCIALILLYKEFSNEDILFCFSPNEVHNGIRKTNNRSKSNNKRLVASTFSYNNLFKNILKQLAR